jgi:hypothetical protein
MTSIAKKVILSEACFASKTLFFSLMTRLRKLGIKGLGLGFRLSSLAKKQFQAGRYQLIKSISCSILHYRPRRHAEDGTKANQKL